MCGETPFTYCITSKSLPVLTSFSPLFQTVKAPSSASTSSGDFGEGNNTPSTTKCSLTRDVAATLPSPRLLKCNLP